MGRASKPFLNKYADLYSLFRPTNPGVLPRDREVLKISFIVDVGASVVIDFQRLVFCDGHRTCHADAGIPL
jgi:hypothetical protein